jgi:hypothetical protein
LSHGVFAKAEEPVAANAGQLGRDNTQALTIAASHDPAASVFGADGRLIAGRNVAAQSSDKVVATEPRVWASAVMNLEQKIWVLASPGLLDCAEVDPLDSVARCDE